MYVPGFVKFEKEKLLPLAFEEGATPAGPLTKKDSLAFPPIVLIGTLPEVLLTGKTTVFTPLFKVRLVGLLT